VVMISFALLPALSRWRLCRVRSPDEECKIAIAVTAFLRPLSVARCYVSYSEGSFVETKRSSARATVFGVGARIAVNMKPMG
jgi:hypothetical protein